MRWMSRNDRRVKKILDQRDYHQWFAWYPVRLTSDTEEFGEIVWLETVNRRLEWVTIEWMPKKEEYNEALRKAKSWPWKNRKRYIYKDLTDIIVEEHNKNIQSK